MKTLQTQRISGREASVLALIAQSYNSLSIKDKERYLNVLSGYALEIAKVMVGETKNPPKTLQNSAEGFFTWAKNL